MGKTHKTNPNELVSEYFFREVTAPLHGTKHSITCDNWFTSVPLIERMLNPPFSLSITGTIRKNKREIPEEMKVAATDPPNTKYCFSTDITLLSHTPKKYKVVLVASSYIHSTAITNNKPNIILHYNETKGGTDCFDQLCHSSTVSRKTNRWPLRVLFGMLDQAAVNARILLKCKRVNSGDDRSVTAISCLQNLALYLVTPHLRQRYTMGTIRTELKLGIAGILGLNTPQSDTQRIHLPHKKRCLLCNRKQDKKTKTACPSCKRPMCDEHRTFMCVDCNGVE